MSPNPPTSLLWIQTQLKSDALARNEKIAIDLGNMGEDRAALVIVVNPALAAIGIPGGDPPSLSVAIRACFTTNNARAVAFDQGARSGRANLLLIGVDPR